MSIGWLVTSDGIRLRYDHRTPKQPRATAVVLTGRNEFIEKYEEVISELVQRDFAVWTLDWRGQGLSTRALPERQRGHVTSFAYYLVDLRSLMRVIADTEPQLPLFVFAHSMGGHIALRYMHDFPDAVHSAVLTAPMIDLATHRYPPGLARVIAQVASLARFAKNYAPGMRDYDPKRDIFDNNDATSDRGRFDARVRLLNENPQLLLGGVTFGWLDAAFHSIDLVRRPEFLTHIPTPMLAFAAQDDRVVNLVALREAAEMLPHCRLVTLNGSRHEILHESDTVRSQYWTEVDQFLDERLGSRSPTQRRRARMR